MRTMNKILAIVLVAAVVICCTACGGLDMSKVKGDWTVETASGKTVETGQRAELMPGEIDKYTVVIWLEGEDPECVNDILGGTIEMMFKLKY